MKSIIIVNRMKYILLISFLLIGMSGCKETPKKKTVGMKSDFTWTTSSEEALTAFEKALVLIDIGDNTGSREYLDEALKIDPDFAIAHVFRSYSSGSAEEFMADTEKAKSLKENLSEGEKILIDINETFISGDNNVRLELNKKLTTLFPKSPRSWLQLGYEHQARNETTKAREMFDKALKLNSNWVGTQTAMGVSYTFDSPTDFNKAKKHFAKAAKLKPNITYTHINLGDAYRALNDLENAKKSYDEAIALDAEHTIALIKRGHANSLLSNFEEARKDYQNSRKYSSYPGLGLPYEAYTYLYEGKAMEGLKWLEDQVKALDELDVSEARKESAKLNCTNICAWIAFHFNKPEHLSNLKTIRNELSSSIAKTVGSENAIQNAKAVNAYWEGLEAVLNKNLETALLKAEENNTYLIKSTDPNKLNNYHFLMGVISYKNTNYTDAIEHFKQGDDDWIYNKYFLAKSYEANNEMDNAMKLFEEISIFNFNTVGYALIRNEIKRKVEGL